MFGPTLSFMSHPLKRDVGHMFKKYAPVVMTNRRKITGGTLKYRDTLPKLPVPPLQQTLQKYVRQCQPHTTPEEYERVKKVVEEFGKAGGVGEKLQMGLLERHENTENWLSDWWRDLSLKDRQPNVLTKSPGALMFRQKFNSTDMQLEYAAKLVANIAQIASALANHTFPPNVVMGAPQCMKQYFSSFGSCRAPRKHLDTVNCHRIDTENGPRHLVVFRNNHVFRFDVLDYEKVPLSTSNILKQLERITQESQTRGPPVGVLTSMARGEWADTYLKMKQDVTNTASLHAIESSLFVLSLDETEESGQKEEDNTYEARLALCGGKQNSGNRWFDKTMLFFVGSNGESGVYGDHSIADGVLIQHILQIVSSNINNSGRVPLNSSPGLPYPEKLEFVLDDMTNKAMDEASKHLDQLLEQFSMEEKLFTSFGKRNLKQLCVSPDGMVQIALQMAFWRIFGHFPNIHGACNMQSFKFGRLEHTRTVTNESVEFVKVFNQENVKSEDKISLLLRALEVHKKINAEAKAGQGMERHLFGLQRIAEENGIDADDFFKDPSFLKSSLINLRTTNTPGNFTRATFSPNCYLPLSAVVWYSVDVDAMRFAITTKKNQPQLDVHIFLQTLFTCLEQMKNLLDKQRTIELI